jgi:hypothetical protein
VTHPAERSACSGYATMRARVPGGRHVLEVCSGCFNAVQRRLASDAAALQERTMPDPWQPSGAGPDGEVIEVPIREVLGRLQVTVGGPLTEYVLADVRGAMPGSEPRQLEAALRQLTLAADQVAEAWDVFVSAETQRRRGEPEAAAEHDAEATRSAPRAAVVDLMAALETSVRQAKDARTRRPGPRALTDDQAEVAARHLALQEGSAREEDPRP